MSCASHSEATHVDDEGKVVWIWYEILLKENNKPKETELHLAQWAILTHDWMSPLRPNGGAAGGSFVAEWGEIHTGCTISETSVFHPAPVTPNQWESSGLATASTKNLFSNLFVCLREGETPREACDYPPVFLSWVQAVVFVW